MKQDLKEVTITFDAVLQFLARNIRVFVLIVLIGTSLGVIASFELPQKYKAGGVLNIQSSYFRNPLVSELISEVYDNSEQTAQRTTLLRKALDDDFLNQLGEKYGDFAYPRNHRYRVLERKKLLDRIEYFSQSQNSFRVSVVADSAMKSYLIAKEVLDQMVVTLVKERRAKLLTTRDAIQDSVNTLDEALENSDPNANVASTLTKELDEINAQVKTLSAQYTSEHPQLERLRLRASTLESALARVNRDSKKSGKDDEDAPLAESTREPTQGIYSDLLRKLNNLNIVVEMEKDPESISYLGLVEQPTIPVTPFFPDKRMFIMIGFVIGLCLAVTRIIYDEFKRGTFLSPRAISGSLDVPFIGEMPVFAFDQSRLLLEAPVVKSLPMPSATSSAK